MGVTNRCGTKAQRHDTHVCRPTRRELKDHRRNSPTTEHQRNANDTQKSRYIYTTIDLSSAYNQIPLIEESKDITAFITPDGLYRFTRVPYRLASASSLFQRMMHVIFKDVKGVLYFQDDILIYATSQIEHDRILRTVLTKLRLHGLNMNREKCRFSQKSVAYLGHTITSAGITPKESLVRAILDAPAPESNDQLRSFLGLCEYVSKFIKNFATKVAPMRQMMKKDVPFTWGVQHEQIFNESSPLVLIISLQVCHSLIR